MESQSKQMLDSLTALQEELSELRLENKHLRVVNSPPVLSPARRNRSKSRSRTPEQESLDENIWGQQREDTDTANDLVVQHRKEIQGMKRQLHEQNLLIEELEKKLADQTEQQTAKQAQFDAKQAQFDSQREELTQIRARVQEFRRTLDKKKKLVQASSPSTPKSNGQTAIQFPSEVPGRLTPVDKDVVDERILEQRAWIHELGERVDIFRVHILQATNVGQLQTEEESYDSELTDIQILGNLDQRMKSLVERVRYAEDQEMESLKRCNSLEEQLRALTKQVEMVEDPITNRHPWSNAAFDEDGRHRPQFAPSHSFMGSPSFPEENANCIDAFSKIFPPQWDDDSGSPPPPPGSSLQS